MTKHFILFLNNNILNLSQCCGLQTSNVGEIFNYGQRLLTQQKVVIL